MPKALELLKDYVKNGYAPDVSKYFHKIGLGFSEAQISDAIKAFNKCNLLNNYYSLTSKQVSCLKNGHLGSIIRLYGVENGLNISTKPNRLFNHIKIAPHFFKKTYEPNKYKGVQFIGLNFDTSIAIDKKSKYGKSYLGKDKFDTDIDDRCKILKESIKAAVASNSVRSQGDTVKIFMAPEFFFRGKGGSYPVHKISEIMEKMRAETSKKCYENWIFVFGTAIGHLEITKRLYEVFNVALVQKGGTASSSSENSLIVYKEKISDLDFISGPKTLDNYSKNTGLIAPVKEHELELCNVKVGNNSGFGTECARSGLGGECAFVMDGISFGLEICLDHLRARLKKSPMTKGYSNIQIHLITGYSVPFTASAVACGKGGFIFVVDGNKGTSLCVNAGTYEKPKVTYVENNKYQKLRKPKAIDNKLLKDYTVAPDEMSINIYKTLFLPKRT
ncbi:MAG: hypothetical protein GY750_19830 [Lentisphaerae bacterium]|nr:hypothetical protein [Lentisphaerota bacterium]MCP4103645.1 hypothetical protein [Lentisphaerota bacterium]